MFRLITHIITYNITVDGRQAVTTDLITTDCNTVDEVEKAKTNLNGLGHGIGTDGTRVGMSVRHAVLSL